MYNEKKKFSIAGDLELEVRIKENKFEIPLTVLFGTAARKNKKRGFLFVSKVLGKHIPVHPQIPQIGGHILAHLFMTEIEKKSIQGTHVLIKALSQQEYIPEAVSVMEAARLEASEPTLFIGFAETATGLGHAMFSAFKKGAGFIHTTRDTIKELKSVFDFQEEHSHATFHQCYSLENDFFNKFSRIVLVDDEITTGKTALNLIRALNNEFPGKKYVIASLLDWRTDEHIASFTSLKNELGIELDVVSLVKGDIKYQGSFENLAEEQLTHVKEGNIKVQTIEIPTTDKHAFTFVDGAGREEKATYLNATGRFGIYAENRQDIELLISEAANKLIETRTKGKCLCLGFSEFIYLPSMIAGRMGDDVCYHSTTRSPVHPINEEGYAIKTAISFENPYDPEIMNFIYNILPGQYDEVYIFLERDIAQEYKTEISIKLSQYSIKHLTFAVFC